MKGRRTDLTEASCGIARALQVIGDWWSLMIVREAYFSGIEKFSDFQRRLGLAKNILSSRLKKLVDAGVFKVEPNPESSVSHRYVLTEKGEALHVVLIALWQWGEEHMCEPGELRHAIVDASSGKALPPLQVRSHNGRTLGPCDLSVAALTPSTESR